MAKPRIILTSGDPNGIGPEIILRILDDPSVTSKCDIRIAGNRNVFDAYAALLGSRPASRSKFENVPLPDGFSLCAGSSDPLAGKHAGDCITAAAKLCLAKKYDAVVTLPVSKETLNLGGYTYPGQTEMLASLSGSGSSLMMMCSGTLKICLATNHLPVAKVSRSIDHQTIIDKVITANNSLVRDFGINNPRIGVLSLNPHAGDGGILGKEEIRILGPAIEGLRMAGFDIKGPFPADAYFATGLYNRFDVTLAMYHDQGLIPFKMISFGRGVNFTAGLNIVRTSPDHGTAFDIAGMGMAETSSTVCAIETAIAVSAHRKRGKGLSKSYQAQAT